MALFAACSGTEPSPKVIAEEVQVNMTFSTQEMKETRAGKTGAMADEQLWQSGVGVFAFFTGETTWSTASATAAPNFMYNQLVEYDDYEDLWEYEPPKFWPNDNADADDEWATGSKAKSYLSFFAYAPYVDHTADLGTTGITDLSGNTATGGPKVTYTLAPKAEDQVDLLWGTRGKATYLQADGTTSVVDLSTTPMNTDLIKQTTTERVDFLFKHALASVDVYVQRIYDEVTPTGKKPADEDQVSRIYISELKLTVPTDGMYTEGVLDLATGQWTGSSTNSSAFDITIDDTRIRPFLVGSKLDNSHLTEVRNMELDEFSSHSGVNASLTRLTNETYATMLIPVDGNAGITVTPTVTYSFVTQDDALELGLTNTNGTHRFARILHENITGGNVTIGTEVSPGNFRLERGKRYILVCYIGVESVQFQVVSVEDWDFPLRFIPTIVDFTGADYKNSDDSKTAEEWQSKTVNE